MRCTRHAGGRVCASEWREERAASLTVRTLVQASGTLAIPTLDEAIGAYLPLRASLIGAAGPAGKLALCAVVARGKDDWRQYCRPGIIYDVELGVSFDKLLRP